jgi:hypothetical protein
MQLQQDGQFNTGAIPVNARNGRLIYADGALIEINLR